MIADRFTAGLTAGFLAGLTAILFELLVVNLLRLGHLAYIDFAGLMLYMRAPQTLGEQITAALIALLFSAFMGIVFAYLLANTTMRFDLLKGVMWGLIVTWMVWMATFLRSARPAESSPENIIGNDLSAIVYGLSLAYFYRYLRAGSFAKARDD